MDLRNYLLMQRGYIDSQGNTVVFSSRGLDDSNTEDSFWIFLDEGLRCGGRNSQISCAVETIQAFLLGCKKQELWDIIASDIAAYDKHF